MSINIKVGFGEVATGAALGAGLGLAVAAPIATGMPGIIPSLAAGFWPFVQSSVALGLSLAGAGVGGWLASQQEQDSHVRGAQYFARPAVAAARLQAQQRVQFSPKQLAGNVAGVRIGGVELSRRAETRGVYVHGLPGGGKTVILTSIIDQAIARGDRLIVHDPKGDFIRRYYDPHSMVLLGPWDSRAAIWDASADMATTADVEQFAASVCGAGAAAGQNRSFHENAATVLGGIIKAAMIDGTRWTWAGLRQALDSDVPSMATLAARGDPEVQKALPSVFLGGDLGQGESAVISVLSSASRWLRAYAAVDAAAGDDDCRFSLRGWLSGTAHDGVRIVVLNSDARYESAGQGIFGAMLACVASMAGSAALPERGPDEPGVWAVLDEFPQLGGVALEKIQKVAELGRSRGIRTVIGLQDESQLAAAVGREKAQPMTAMQATRVFVECSESGAAEIAKRIGEREVQRIDSTAQGGANQGKTKRTQMVPVILPSALTGLRVRKPTRLGVGGAECIVAHGDELGLLVQPFPERRDDAAPAQVESDAWAVGTLRRPAPAPTPAPAEPLGSLDELGASLPPGVVGDDEGDGVNGGGDGFGF